MFFNCDVGEDSRVPWTAGRSNQSILAEISPGSSLEGLMLNLKLRYLGHLMQRVDSLEKTLMLIEGRRRRGWQRMRWLDGIPDSVDMSLGNSGIWWWTGKPGVLRSMGSQRIRHDWVTELNWRLYHPVPMPTSTPAPTWNCRFLFESFSESMQANLPCWKWVPPKISLIGQSFFDYLSGIKNSLLNEEALIVLRKLFLKLNRNLSLL